MFFVCDYDYNMLSKRKFGIEIEMTGVTREQVLIALNKFGINAKSMGYEHTTRQFWKIVSDSSVTGATIDMGFELVSPILEGKKGLDEIEKVSAALVEIGAEVDHTCGFHVHVDARDLDAIDLVWLVEQYSQHECSIDNIMPKCRKKNTYCDSIARNYKYLLEHFSAKTSFVEAKEILEKKIQENRINASTILSFVGSSWYRRTKLNLAPLARQGTVEFRQHEGTVLASKIIPWVEFCVNFVEKSKLAQVESMPIETPQAKASWKFTSQILDLFPEAHVNARWKTEIFVLEALANQTDYVPSAMLQAYIKETYGREIVVALVLSRLKEKGVEIYTRRNVGYKLITPLFEALRKCLCTEFQEHRYMPLITGLQELENSTKNNFLKSKKTFPAAATLLFEGLEESTKTYFKERMEFLGS